MLSSSGFVPLSWIIFIIHDIAGPVYRGRVPGACSTSSPMMDVRSLGQSMTVYFRRSGASLAHE
jgi:hypothetical protein